MMIFARKNRKAFSLLETIVASLLLSSGVGTLCALSTRSLTAVKSNREYEHAWELLDRQLTFIDYMGIEEFIELGQTSGRFGEEDDKGQAYFWEAEIEEGTSDYLYHVDITVFWGPEGRADSGRISASTALDGIGSLFLPEEEQQ